VIKMSIVVVSRRRRLASVARDFPGAVVLDVTSKGPEPWVRFSPFFPHGGIPIPYAPPGLAAQSVEGLWQGLKVFEHEDVDPRKWAITTMSGIKRAAGGRRGAVRGHRFGPAGDVLLDYHAARLRIYLPAYRWVLENRVAEHIERLRALSRAGTAVLLDYETNADVADLARPLSHAALIKHYIEGTWARG
jgi:hypothetical protein